jgi:hypothetical protein
MEITKFVADHELFVPSTDIDLASGEGTGSHEHSTTIFV